MPDVKLSWDGERVKQEIKAEDVSYAPFDIVVQVHSGKARIDAIGNQLKQLKANRENLKKELEAVTLFLKDRLPFMDKCEQLQIEKLKKIISEIHEECKKKSMEESEEEIKKDPMALNEFQKKQLPYLKYQKMLATHGKIAIKIAPQIITEYLYETPVFDNPFEDSK